MVQKFTAKCDFGGRKIPVTLYIGNPSPNTHPLEFQNRWLSKEKGGAVPSDIMESFNKLQKISNESKVSFEELCKYVIDELQSSGEIENDFNKATQFSDPKNTQSDNK